MHFKQWLCPEDLEANGPMVHLYYNRKRNILVIIISTLQEWYSIFCFFFNMMSRSYQKAQGHSFLTAEWPSNAMFICTWQGLSLIKFECNNAIKHIHRPQYIYNVTVIYSFHISMKHRYLIKNIQILLRGQNEMQ